MSCIGSTVTAGDVIAASQPAVTMITSTRIINITNIFPATVIIIIIITTIIIIIATIITIIMITRSSTGAGAGAGAGAVVGVGSKRTNIYNNGSWNRNTERMTHTPRRYHTTPTIPNTSF